MRKCIICTCNSTLSMIIVNHIVEIYAQHNGKCVPSKSGITKSFGTQSNTHCYEMAEAHFCLRPLRCEPVPRQLLWSLQGGSSANLLVGQQLP